MKGKLIPKYINEKKGSITGNINPNNEAKAPMPAEYTVMIFRNILKPAEYKRAAKVIITHEKFLFCINFLISKLYNFIEK
ncbi:MAG: hypothetical protein DSZ21_02660 [Tenericutes bacterium]|nr:MAG: hypothetical protein DSZ21_02660 [Mycoplasmatota bacterium]